MGFSIKLLIALPDRQDNRTAWEIDHEVDFGRITRLDKLVERRDLNYSGKVRAGICVFDGLFKPYIESIHSVQEGSIRDLVAPPFIITDPDSTPTLSWWKDEIPLDASGKPVKEYIIPASRIGRGLSQIEVLKAEDPLRQHNEYIYMTDAELCTFVNSLEYNPTIDNLLLWFPAKRVTHWMEAFQESIERTGWKELNNDLLSIMYFNIWKYTLEQYAHHSARVIFKFGYI